MLFHSSTFIVYLVFVAERHGSISYMPCVSSDTLYEANRLTHISLLMAVSSIPKDSQANELTANRNETDNSKRYGIKARTPSSSSVFPP
jgi:hypothetical protein